LNRHDLDQAAALFFIAFGGWFDDPMVRMIQVKGVKAQPCPTMFSDCFAPSVSHLVDETNKL